MKFAPAATIIIMVVGMLSGCTAFRHLERPSAISSCVHPIRMEIASQECDLMPWLDYWLQANSLNWKERQQQLSALGSTSADRVKMILLSHVPGTPYQSRLRAQLVAQLFTENHQGKLAKFIQLIVFLPAQEKLELESALATQTRFNIHQEKQLQHQREQLSDQELQINKLLQIEKNIIAQPIEGKP